MRDKIEDLNCDDLVAVLKKVDELTNQDKRKYALSSFNKNQRLWDDRDIVVDVCGLEKNSVMGG